jgi:hypothetical protein
MANDKSNRSTLSEFDSLLIYNVLNNRYRVSVYYILKVYVTATYLLTGLVLKKIFGK